MLWKFYFDAQERSNSILAQCLCVAQIDSKLLTNIYFSLLLQNNRNVNWVCDAQNEDDISRVSLQLVWPCD